MVRWHRSGFTLYWRLISRFPGRAGRERISKEIRDLIFRMVTENPSWGAPRIHGELLMLGFDVSERTISRWIRRAPRDPEPAKRWLIFLRNHREAIAAMDFFTIPTITFGVLYCFFVIHHSRRRILHFNVTRHPSSGWIVQQLREAFPDQSAPRFLIFDRDAKYGLEVPIAVRSMDIRPVRTSIQSPWQNGVAERSFLERDWAACITVTIELRNNRGRTHRRTDRSIARLMCVSSYVAIQASAQSSQSFEHTPCCHVFLNYGLCR